MPTEPTDREVRDAITADRTWASGYAAGRAAALGPDSELRRLRSEFAEAADRWEAAADEARKGNHRSSFAGETDLPAHVLSRTRMLVFRHVVESIDAALTDSRPDSIDAAWAAVEAVLPEGSWMTGLTYRHAMHSQDAWEASATVKGLSVWDYGTTPAAALRALEAHLAAHPAEAEESHATED